MLSRQEQAEADLRSAPVRYAFTQEVTDHQEGGEKGGWTVKPLWRRWHWWAQPCGPGRSERRRGDPPYLLGREPGRRGIPRKLSWYQPQGRCHWIAFFSMAIGVLNYPRLDWRFVSGDLHTIPVGYGADGKPVVVVDILLFEGMTAEQSLALATKKLDDKVDAKAGMRATGQLAVWRRLPDLTQGPANGRQTPRAAADARTADAGGRRHLWAGVADATGPGAEPPAGKIP